MRATVTADDSSLSGLEELYVHHAPAALRLAYFLTGDPDAARDLVQDAFVRMAGRFRHLRQRDAFDAYLRRTIVNLHSSGLRRLRAERSSFAREAALSVPAANEDDHGARDEMWHAILSLPPRQRAAIVLRYYEDLSEWQSAEVLRCSVGALNQLVVRAMANLRNRIGKEAR
jgi:RNA polymerase sigma-70 factor (sigma-E family)